jgi:hypothetical protein
MAGFNCLLRVCACEREVCYQCSDFNLKDDKRSGLRDSLVCGKKEFTIQNLW